MSAIRPISPDLVPAARAAATDPAAEKKQPSDTAKVAREFESIFVRQILSAAKIGGENNGSGYGSMIVDALASGIASGGGLGLGKQIEEALTAMNERAARPR